jgi:hypothetical protein
MSAYLLARKFAARHIVIVVEVRLPCGEDAVVEIGKLTDYCLNATHPRGRHKARVFPSALRIFQGDAEFLRARLLEAALESDAVAGEFDDYGQRYIVDFECVSGGLRAIIRSAWIVRRGEHFPRLTTCYVLSN